MDKSMVGLRGKRETNISDDLFFNILPQNNSFQIILKVQCHVTG